MALAVRDHIKPHKMLNGTPFPIWAVAKASGTTWLEGAVLIGTSGLAVEAADGPTMGTILGIAQSPALDGETIALIIPALPGVVFSGAIATGDDGGDYTSLIGNRFMQFGLAKDDSSLTWYINVADVTDEAALVMDFIDDIGDNLARVQFTIIDSVFSSMALHQ